MPDLTPYEIAVSKDESRELSLKLIDVLPSLALPGAQVGVGLVGLALTIRHLLNNVEPEKRDLIREGIVTIINLPENEVARYL